MIKLDFWKEYREDSNNTKYYDKNGNVQVIVNKGVNSKGKPTCKMWFGKSQKPKYSYYFESEERCIKFINENTSNYICGVNQKIDKKELVKEVRKKYEPKVQIGDIFHITFGYSMTLNEFFQVIAINNKKITIREISMDMEEVGYLYYKVKPIANSFIGKEQVKNLQIDFSNVNKPNEYIRIKDYRACNVTEDVKNGRTWSENRCD